MTKVRRVELLMVGLPLVRPFRTSFGIATRKECVVVRIETDASEGWGECVADIEPDFSSEWNQSVWSAIEGFLGPAVLREEDVSASSLSGVFGSVGLDPDDDAFLARRDPERGSERPHERQPDQPELDATDPGHRAASSFAKR